MKNLLEFSLSFCLLLVASSLAAQDTNASLLPYREIPPYPEKYTAATVAARVIDGLGFRFYWATESLRDEDLAYKPSDEARSSLETLRHIHGLSVIILNSVKMIPNEANQSPPEHNFADLRMLTLENLKTSSDILKASDENELEEFRIIFKGANGATEFPFWNQLNGPIADALWHVGQVVSFRRSSGNPFNSQVSVLAGKLRN